MNAVTFDHDTDRSAADAGSVHPERAKRKKLFGALGATIAIAALGYGLLADRDHVSTDNAYVGAETAQVTPLIAGAVAAVPVVNTDSVRRGEVLMRLDDTDARFALTRAEAEYQRVRRQFAQAEATSGAMGDQIAASAADVARARAQLDIASAAFAKARIDLDRRNELVASGAVSGEELTTARNAFAAAQGNLAQARAALAQASAARDAAQGNRAANDALIAGTSVETHPDVVAARARRDQARVDLARTVIRAPIDGVIINRQVQVGQRIAAGAAAMTIVPIAALHVDANFKEGQLERVRPGQRVTLTSDLYGSKVVYHGRVAGFSGGTGAAFSLIPAQNATGNWIKVVQRLPVRITLDPQELAAHPLRVGLSMEAEIDLAAIS